MRCFIFWMVSTDNENNSIPWILWNSNVILGVTRVVDLCAAPGSWSQVLSKKLYETSSNPDDVKIVAVDLQAMAPLPGERGCLTYCRVHIISRSQTTAGRYHQNQYGPRNYWLFWQCKSPTCHLRWCTRRHRTPRHWRVHSVTATSSRTEHYDTCPRTGRHFVAKIFRGKDTTLLYSQLKIFFRKVSITKPSSSRNSSIEAFVVCQNYQPPDGYVPQMINPLADVKIIVGETESPVNKQIIPFVVCGDLRGYDSDMSYSLAVSFSVAFFYCNNSRAFGVAN